MKKKKLIFYSIIIVVLLSFLTVGTIAMVLKDNYKNNNVIFELNDEKAYCNIKGNYFYNNEEVTSSAYEAYDQSYYEGSDYTEDGFDGFDPWILPDASFTGEGTEVYKFEIVITNYNTEYALTANLRNVAVGDKVINQTPDFLFYTTISYQIGSGQNEIKFSNKESNPVNTNLYTGNNLISLDAVQIPVAQSLKITIEIERKTKVEPINSNNNFSIVLGVVGDE